MIQVARGAPASRARRGAAYAARRGLVEVLAGSDRPTPPRSTPLRRCGTALTMLGVALVAFAIVDIVVALSGRFNVIGHATPSPSWAILSANPHIDKVVFAKAVITNGWLQWSPMSLAVGATLLACRRPLLGWRIAYLSSLLTTVLPPAVRPSWDSIEAVLLAAVLCLAGWRHTRPVLWWMCAFMVLPFWLWLGPGWTDVAVAETVLAIIATAVDAAGASQRAKHALAAQSERTELEEARRTVLEERTRIARELHDVVAHHMSLIAVQTETAPYRIGGLPNAALAELSSVNRQAREALADMRRLLSVLRDDRPAELSPQPRLDDLPGLVDASRRVGLAVELSMPADGIPPPPSIGLCAYRVVQEALSNAGRHAPGSVVSVTVQSADNDLRVRVTNGPPLSPPAPLSPRRRGHGLVGMRERVATAGGTLSIAPTPDGGFTVSAVIPLTPSIPLTTR